MCIAPARPGLICTIPSSNTYHNIDPEAIIKSLLHAGLQLVENPPTHAARAEMDGTVRLVPLLDEVLRIGYPQSFHGIIL